MTAAACPPPLVLTMGEPAGIGVELALKAWRARGDGVPPFVLLADADVLRHQAASLGLPADIAVVDDPAAGRRAWSQALPVIHIELAAPVAPGQPTPANGAGVIAAIDLAVALTRDRAAAGMVTNPIHKHVLYEAGFAQPGHTEYLGKLCGVEAPVMMLTVPGLRVVPVTVHLRLAEAPSALTGNAIVHCGRTTATALRSLFGIAAPRLAVAALNPHAGEHGTFGHEEATIIAPAVARLRADGLAVAGPAPADTLFHAAARATYDAAMCMYHDQALIPLKTIDFRRGVNVTLGLPIIRTSPDHGTALDIAGKGIADATSLIEALRLAAELAANADAGG